MKGDKRLFLILGILIPILAACNLLNLIPAASGNAFSIGIDSPAPGAVLPGGPVNILYHASSTDGISQVELSMNNEVVNLTTNDNA